MGTPTTLTTSYGTTRKLKHNRMPALLSAAAAAAIPAVQRMAKMSERKEARRAELENSLALLAGARVRVELVALRVQSAGAQAGLSELLGPASEELGAIDRRIQDAQRELRVLWEELQPRGER